MSGGSITLTTAATYAIIGINYTATYKSHRLAYGSQKGSSLGQEKRQDRLALMLEDTVGGSIAWGHQFDDDDVMTVSDRLASHRDGDLTDSPVSLWNEDVAMSFQGDSSIDPRFGIVMDTPAPATVLALVVGIETHDR